MSYVLEPGDPGYDEQGFGCCDGEDPEDPESCQCRHRLHGDPRSPGQKLQDFNRQCRTAGSRSRGPPWSPWKC